MNTRFHEVALTTHNLCIQADCGEGVNKVFVNVCLHLTGLVHLVRLIYGFSLVLHRVWR